MFTAKSKAEVLSSFREINLKIIFQILFDVKEQQLLMVPKTEQNRMNKLFDIMGNVSLLHNQIFHLSKEQSSTKQIYDHVLRLHRINVEKSIYDYINDKEEKKENKEKEKKFKKEATVSFSTLVIDSNQSSFAELTPLKEKDIIMTKLNKPIDSDKKKYLKVNRTLHCNSHRQFPSPLKMNKKIVKNSNSDKKDNNIKNDININNIITNNRQSASLLPNTCEKKKKSKLLFEETKPPLKKAFSKSGSNFHCVTLEQKYQWMPLSLYSQVKTPKKRKNNNLILTEKSFEKNHNSHSKREIGKPSSYAKYLLRKYKDVIDSYGEEIRQSLNSSARLHRSSSKKDGSKERQLIEITPYHNS